MTGIRLGDELAIIAAGPQPQVFAARPTTSGPCARRPNSSPPSDGPTRVGEAVALARAVAPAPKRTRKVIVLSDGAFEGADDLGQEPTSS